MLEDPNQRGEFDSGFKFYAIGCASEGWRGSADSGQDDTCANEVGGRSKFWIHWFESI
jgi:hypothetical protein